MHKTKEGLQKGPLGIVDQEIEEAIEAANEEEYEANNGAMSTDGVGTGFDAEGRNPSKLERAQSSGDGPASGEMTDPPTTLKTKKKSKKGVLRGGNASNHPAAFSTKSI